MVGLALFVDCNVAIMVELAEKTVPSEGVKNTIVGKTSASNVVIGR